MKRSGYVAQNSSTCQSLYADTMMVERSLSDTPLKKLPAKPANPGKHIDASTPLRDMSRTRSWMS